MPNFFTVDIEKCYYSNTYADKQIIENNNELLKSIELIINLLKSGNSKATFFILGGFAEEFPNTVKMIFDEGFEIASHGNTHVHLNKLTDKEFVYDIQKSKDLLESIIGTNIYGYRAPYFSLSSNDLVKLNLLKDYGYEYSSSIYPNKIISNNCCEYYSKDFEYSNGLKEYPMSTLENIITNIPFSGGAYFRFYPYLFTDYLIKKKIVIDNYFMFYIHPWEFSKNHLSDNKSLISRFRHYYNIENNSQKLSKLLNNYTFTSIGNRSNYE